MPAVAISSAVLLAAVDTSRRVQEAVRDSERLCGSSGPWLESPSKIRRGRKTRGSARRLQHVSFRSPDKRIKRLQFPRSRSVDFFQGLLYSLHITFVTRDKTQLVERIESFDTFRPEFGERCGRLPVSSPGCRTGPILFCPLEDRLFLTSAL